MEIATDFIFLGFKITVDRYYSHEIKRYLLLETPWTIQSMEFSRPEYWSG